MDKFPCSDYQDLSFNIIESIDRLSQDRAEMKSLLASLAVDVRVPTQSSQVASGPMILCMIDWLNGNQLKLLCVLDEYTRECLAIEVRKSLRSQDVILTLSRLMRICGKPTFIRSDNGGEFIATAVMKWLREQNVEQVL